MTPTLSDELRQAVAEHDGAPVYVVDPATNTSYVLLRADQFESVRALLPVASEDSDSRALYPLVEQSFGRAGWDDPEMDVYNDYDSHRPRP